MGVSGSGKTTIGQLLARESGIAVVGAAPAVITTVAMNVVLRDDPILHETEREARKAGRIATVVGAAGGSVAAVSSVAAAGTVAGLGATGISSGLAAIGATVGEGMAAGVVVTAAAPAVAAAALGYGAYRLWRWRRTE